METVTISTELLQEISIALNERRIKLNNEMIKHMRNDDLFTIITRQYTRTNAALDVVSETLGIKY